MDSRRRKRIAALLAAKRAEIEDQIGGIEDAVTHSTAGGISFGKRVGDGTSIAVERLSQVAAHEGLHDTLAQLARAEASLAAGSYGVCAGCGQDIPAGRLEARPFATRCVGCASVSG
ncbi:MAG: TraR/DksA family transcriptional regulator [Frankiales bacterium]|jgi:DnaK suppressor protein|nr:TraR/DksA family transcriptional regulator [Frankiales bacterium]